MKKQQLPPEAKQIINIICKAYGMKESLLYITKRSHQDQHIMPVKAMVTAFLYLKVYNNKSSTARALKLHNTNGHSTVIYRLGKHDYFYKHDIQYRILFDKLSKELPEKEACDKQKNGADYEKMRLQRTVTYQERTIKQLRNELAEKNNELQYLRPKKANNGIWGDVVK